jgi:hypothetical protein
MCNGYITLTSRCAGSEDGALTRLALNCFQSIHTAREQSIVKLSGIKTKVNSKSNRNINNESEKDKYSDRK